MVLSGLLPININRVDFVDTIAARAATQLRGFGFRSSISNAATGDDVWSGTATTLPVPPDVGEQMQVVSTSASDTAAGIGVRTLEVHYIDASGNQQVEVVTMNGVTPVLTVATNIRFVQQIHTLTAGTNLLAVGTITISTAGVPATIYTQIQPQTNRSLNTARMVPAGKVLLITAFHGSAGAAAGGKSADVRLRFTASDGNLTPRLFQFQDNFLGFNSAASRAYDHPLVLPAFGIIKCTAYATTAGADVQASWEGIFVDTPV